PRPPPLERARLAGAAPPLPGPRRRLRRAPAPPPRTAAGRLGAPARRERALRVAIAGPHQVPVLPRVGVEDRERAEAAPLLAGLDDGDGHAVEASPLHARVQVARVADRPPHDVRAQKPSCPGLRPGPSSASRQGGIRLAP